MATVLITCAGSGVGQSVIDSLIISKDHKLIGCDSNRNVYANHFCDAMFIAPSIFSDEYLDFLLELCIDQKIDLIIPGHDHELLLFSKNISRFLKEGINIIVSEPEIIKVSRDKYEWYNYFTEFNCSIVPTFRINEFLVNPDTSIFPAIIKPRGGSASKGVFVAHDMSELARANDSDIIQPYVFPRKEDPNYHSIQKAVQEGRFVQMSEISIQLIFTQESEYTGIFISRNTLKDGVPVFIDPIIPDEFEYIDEIMKFIPVCLEKGVRGPVNIQGRITEKGLLFFEMNMRFTGITGNRAQLGFNEVAYLVDNYLGIEVKLRGYARKKLGVRQVACATIPRLANLTDTNYTYTILGASGFIGSNFVNELILKNEYETINLICRESSYEKYQRLFPSKGITILKETDSMLQSAYSRSDVVVNFSGALAFKPDDQIYESIIFQYQQVQKIIRSGIPLIINVSSQSIYDQKTNLIKDEKAAPAIDNTYAFQKFMAESFFNSVRTFSPSARSISLRFSRVVGTDYTGNAPKGFFASVIESLINDLAVDIPYPNNNTNLIDLRDVIESILFIIYEMKWDDLPGIMNVGGTNLTVQDFCNTAIDCLNLSSKRDLIKYGNSSEVTTSSMIDSGLFQSYKWSKKYSLEETIKNIAKSFTPEIL